MPSAPLYGAVGGGLGLVILITCFLCRELCSRFWCILTCGMCCDSDGRSDKDGDSDSDSDSAEGYDEGYEEDEEAKRGTHVSGRRFLPPSGAPAVSGSPL